MSFIKNILTALLRRLNLLKPEIVRYNDLKAYPMINSITFSSDMTTLYLIDNGRAISFPLGKEKMILVGTLKGQITVATSLTADEMAGNPELSRDTPEALSSGALAANGGGGEGTLKVPVSLDAQWTLVFNRKHQIMALIGVTEINPGLNADEPTPLEPQGFTFDLQEIVVGITRIGNALVFNRLRRGEKPPVQ